MTDQPTRRERPCPATAGPLLGPGSLIRDYRIEAELAAGGFGTVYRARHEVLGRVAAIKVLHAEIARSGDGPVRFEREARIANLIRHPNVVDVFELDQLPDGRPYFVMEYLEGVDLETHLDRNGPLSPAAVADILDPVCQALHAAHASCVIHRDLKASNVFLANAHGRRRVVLLDFGISKLLSAGVLDLTTSRHIVGTPSAMAPEQLTGGPIDQRTDVYGLGVLTYHLLTGRPPYGEHSRSVMQHMHLHAERPRPSARAPVPEAIDAVVAQAMSTDPAERQPGALELLAGFRGALEAAHATTASRATPSRALAVYVDLRAIHEGEPGEEPEEAIAALEDALGLVARELGRAGFQRAMQTPCAGLFVRVLPRPAAEEQAARGEAVSAVLALWDLLTAEGGIHATMALHADHAITVGAEVKGGAILHLTGWLPAAPGGVLSSRAAIEGLALADPEPAAGPIRIRPAPA